MAEMDVICASASSARLLLKERQEAEMQVMVEVTTALTGVALGVVAGRLFLEGILNVAFRKTRT